MPGGRNKRRKDSPVSPNSSDSLELETDILARIKSLEIKIDRSSNIDTDRLIKEIETVQGQLHELLVDNDILRKEVTSLYSCRRNLRPLKNGA